MHLPAKKSLGQHFLNSPHVLGQIISAAHIQKEENVLEIGPGTGFLTRALLDAGAKVTAVEKDVRAIGFLQEIFAPEVGSGQLTLISGDILDLRKEIEGKQTLPPSYLLPHTSYALIANIPYYITGAILESFLEYTPRPNRMVLLVQKEVAERIVAKNIDGTEGGKGSILSISVKAFGEPSIIAKVPAGAFTPPPNVDSAILGVQNISDGHFKRNNVAIPRFFEILKAGFTHKRKFVMRNIESVVSQEKIREIWPHIDLSEKVRAEDIPLEKWLKMAQLLG